MRAVIIQSSLSRDVGAECGSSLEWREGRLSLLPVGRGADASQLNPIRASLLGFPEPARLPAAMRRRFACGSSSPKVKRNDWLQAANEAHVEAATAAGRKVGKASIRQIDLSLGTPSLLRKLARKAASHRMAAAGERSPNKSPLASAVGGSAGELRRDRKDRGWLCVSSRPSQLGPCALNASRPA